MCIKYFFLIKKCGNKKVPSAQMGNDQLYKCVNNEKLMERTAKWGGHICGITPLKTRLVCSRLIVSLAKLGYRRFCGVVLRKL